MDGSTVSQALPSKGMMASSIPGSIGGRAEATQPPTPGCPACGGSLNPAGGVWRCGRCRFAMCVGCCVDEPAEGE